MKSKISSIRRIIADFRLSRTTIAIIIVLVLIVFVVSVGARGWLRTRATPISQDNTGSSSQIGAELVTLRRFGFEPAQITRSHGSFILEVDNRAEVTSMDLRLDRVGHERVREVHVPREKLDWVEILPDLPAGEYVLTEANHPDWVCRITLTN